MSGNLGWIPPTWIYAITSVLLTSLASLGGLVIRKTLQNIKKDWDVAMTKLTTIEDIQRIQAENHLQTIQAESVKQTGLLTDMLQAQAETNGYLKAVVELSKKVS